jgi:serine/threonine protein kinase
LKSELLAGHFARAIIQKMLEPEPEDRFTSSEVVQQLSVIMKPQEVMNNDYDDNQVTINIFIIKNE